MNKTAINKASKKTMFYIQISKNLKISHKKLHACFFGKKDERSVRTRLTAKQLTDGTKGWAFVWGWVLWLYTPSLYMLKGEVNPAVALLVLLMPCFFTHSLPSPAQHPTHARHPSRLPVCAHQTVSQISAHRICPFVQKDTLVSSPDRNWAESMLWEAPGRAVWPFLDRLWWAWDISHSRGRGLTMWAGWVHWLKLEQQWKSHLD